MSWTNSAGECREAVLGQHVPALPVSALLFHPVCCLALRSYASHICSKLASEWIPPASSPWPALLLYGALPWWFCYSDNSVKGEPSLSKFTCLPSLLFTPCTYVCVCVYIWIHTRTYTYAYMYICPLQICTYTLTEGSSRSLPVFQLELPSGQ